MSARNKSGKPHSWRSWKKSGACGCYRHLVVSRVHVYPESGSLDISFANASVSFVFSRENAKRLQISHVKAGQSVFIKGHGPHGNEDCMLARFDPLEDIFVEPAIV